MTHPYLHRRVFHPPTGRQTSEQLPVLPRPSPPQNPPHYGPRRARHSYDHGERQHGGVAEDVADRGPEALRGDGGGVESARHMSVYKQRARRQAQIDPDCDGGAGRCTGTR